MENPQGEPEIGKQGHGVRPYGVGDKSPTILPTRRSAAQVLAAAGIVSPLGVAVGVATMGNQPFGNQTPKAIRERTAGSLTNSSFSISATRWTSYTIDRPTILVTVSPDDTLLVGNQQITGGFWYNYGQIPQGLPSGSGSATGGQWAHAGVAFLGSPGTWYLRAQSGLGNADVLLMTVDAFELGTAFKWLLSPGANFVLQTNFSLSVVTAVTQLLAPARGRIAARIQCVPPTGAGGNPVRLSFNKPPSYLTTGAAWTNVGYRLVVGEHVDISGDFLTRGTVNGIAEAAVSGATVEVLDYYDWL